MTETPMTQRCCCLTRVLAQHGALCSTFTVLDCVYTCCSWIHALTRPLALLLCQKHGTGPDWGCCTCDTHTHVLHTSDMLLGACCGSRYSECRSLPHTRMLCPHAADGDLVVWSAFNITRVVVLVSGQSDPFPCGLCTQGC
jgi:hypothetical protein